MDNNGEVSTSTSQIRSYKSIITLIVFVVTNIIVLFPFHIPFYVPRWLSNIVLDGLSSCRIISTQRKRFQHDGTDDDNGKDKPWVRLRFPMNFVTAPLIADLFLLAILAIGRKEVHDGTIGADSILPYNIMLFFLSLAYIAISIDASGLIRWLAFKVLQKAGKVGHLLFFYLYAFFFVLGSFIGNDPIILSGTAFLAYMTRVSSNIVHPRAWIHTQFAVANIASAILVSSNPTNLVLAGAFHVTFIKYTANMIVPVIVTAIVLFPFLLYIVFAEEALIPLKIEMHSLTPEEQAKVPINPNIPDGRGIAEEQENVNDEQGKVLSLEEIMNPFVDRKGAAFGALIMTATLVTLLAVNASDQGNGKDVPVFYITLPAAVVMFCWDLASGWINRKKTREISKNGREEKERFRAEQAEQARIAALGNENFPGTVQQGQEDVDRGVPLQPSVSENGDDVAPDLASSVAKLVPRDDTSQNGLSTSVTNTPDGKQELDGLDSGHRPQRVPGTVSSGEDEEKRAYSERISDEAAREQKRTSVVTLVEDAHRWAQETFPTCTAVLSHLPYALLPFAFSMFVLVQGLVTNGWVPVFAYGWDHWVKKTGTVGAIGGMGFISTLLCNFAGTNIGTTILLCRVIQAWVQIHHLDGTIITERTFWGTVYAMALGVNYGAFSTAFSASLAGLLWRDILGRKHIHVRRLDFARVNLPIIAIAMAVGCSTLIIQIYITRSNNLFDPDLFKNSTATG
ncbi:putative arsenite transmembrane transporter protein [Stipitochalara longipes BDJ]|nr:putative arsenite transmembrane transporter protein [Stipitochalara longipes BDJ]